jgi:type IV pilus assembly protein PilX
MTPMHIARTQQGVSLIVVMILLLLMSLVTIASLRGTLFNERMAASAVDRNQALQEAEAAMREAEAFVQVPANRTGWPTAGCDTNGRCATPNGSSTDRWKDSSFTAWRAAGVSTSSTSAGAPQYFVEFLGQGPNWPGCAQERPRSPNCLGNRYRVSARSAAVDGRATVLLQSTISTP